MPGTAEKVRVLVWRHTNGFLLWHPADAKLDQFKTVRRPIVLYGDNGKPCGGGMDGSIFGWEQVEDGPEQREVRQSEDWWGVENPGAWE